MIDALRLPPCVLHSVERPGDVSAPGPGDARSWARVPRCVDWRSRCARWRPVAEERPRRLRLPSEAVGTPRRRVRARGL